MSVRVRVAVALIVAAVVPLLGAYAVAGFLVPRALGGAETNRLQQEATTVAVVLSDDCRAVGDLVRTVVSRLQVAGTVAGTEVTLAEAVAAAAPDVVADAAVSAAEADIFVLGTGGEVLATDAERILDLQGYLDASCSTSTAPDGEPAALVEKLDVQLGSESVATVLAASPLTDRALNDLRLTLGILDSELALVDGDGLVASTPDLQPDGRDADLVEAAADAAAGSRDEVDGRRYVVGPQVAGTGLRVVAVGARAETTTTWVFLAALLLSLLGAALLVQVLSTTLTRPLAELGELARRIAAGDLDTATGDDPSLSDADADVLGVGTVLERLARNLRATEADLERGRGAFVDAFNRFGETLEQTHDRDGLLHSYLEAAMLAGQASAAVILHDESGSSVPRRVLSTHRGVAGPADLDAAVLRRLTELGEQAITDRTIAIPDDGEDLGTAVALPLVHEERLLGAVVVAREPGQRGFDAVALEALGALVGSAGTALVNEERHRETERLSVTDPLTGLGNFRHLTAMLSREVERAARFDHPLGILMVDIDHFKRVNDTYGHGPGDAVLRDLARRLSECVREVDTVARYGGEEFTLLLPETDLAGTVKLAERVVAAFRGEPFRVPGGGDLLVTGSVGVASYPLHGLTGTELMRTADAAMYTAKSSGRDRYVVADVPSGRAAEPARAPGTT